MIMNNKVLILTENVFLKKGITYEIEKLGFKSASSLQELTASDVLIVDTSANVIRDYDIAKVLYIVDSDSKKKEYSGKYFLTRPFSMIEFDNILLSLTSDSVMPEPAVIKSEKLAVSIFDEYVVVNGIRIELTKNEMLIFSELWKSKGKAVSREQLENVIEANRDGNIVTVYINHLREKFSSVSEKRIIKTIRGGGYSISEF
jgi:hypothetical protein